MTSLRRAFPSSIVLLCLVLISACGKSDVSDQTSTLSGSSASHVPQAAEAYSSYQDTPGTSGWIPTTEKDEMTGKETSEIIFAESVDDADIEVQIGCSNVDRLHISGVPARLTLDVRVFKRNLATDLYTFAVGSPARIDLGNGDVTTIVLSQDGKFSNVYEAHVYAQGKRFEADATRLKLELQFDNGVKYIVKGDEVLATHLRECYVDKSAREAEAAAAAAAAAAAEAEAMEKEAVAIDAASVTTESAAITPPRIIASRDRILAAINTCYPSASRRLSEEGRVVVTVTIGADGKAGAMRVVEGSGFERIDAAAECVIRRLPFDPGKRNGQSVESQATLPIVFSLEH